MFNLLNNINVADKVPVQKQRFKIINEKLRGNSSYNTHLLSAHQDWALFSVSSIYLVFHVIFQELYKAGTNTISIFQMRNTGTTFKDYINNKR